MAKAAAEKKEMLFDEQSQIATNENPNNEQPIENAPAVNFDSLMPHDLENDVDNIFAEMERRKGVEVTANYIDFGAWAVGDSRDFIFHKMTTFTKPDTGETIPAVLLMDRAKLNYICAAKVVVESLSRLDKIPAPVRILYKGKVKSAAGSYHAVQVFAL